MRKTPHSLENNPPPGSVCGIALVAFRIFHKYPNRLPTAGELMADNNFERSTAYRWLAAIKAARGIA